MQHFLYFHFLLFRKTSWNNWMTMNWRSTSLVDMDSKLMTKLSQDGGRFMMSTMYTFSSSIFISMEHNWSTNTFTMLMCINKSSPSCILMVKNLFWINNLFPIILVSCTPQSVSQTLLAFSQYWMCASCAYVICSQNNANALVFFYYSLSFHLHHWKLLHSHEQIFKSHVWKALCES